MAFWPKGSSSAYPTIVLESGWIESWERLWDDRKLWAGGTGYGVNIVILVKIFPPPANDDATATGAPVCAKLEISSYDSHGSIGVFIEVGFIYAYALSCDLPFSPGAKSIADALSATCPGSD